MKPGTVARITTKQATYLAFWDAYNGVWVSANNGRLTLASGADVRTLVVLDLGYYLASDAVDDLRCLADEAEHRFGWDETAPRIRLIADQIESQTKPKPAEPTGLGAVVEDTRGVRWVRAESAKGMRNPWQATLHAAEPDEIRFLTYAEVDAVRVLSEGVQP